MAKRDPKEEALRRCGALNTHAVTDPLFEEGGFFDPRDLVQVKYEMLRRVRKDGEPVSQVAKSFGLSRPWFYKTSRAFDREGVMGLLPQKRGPQRRHKLNAEIIAFVREFRGEERLTEAAILDGIEKRFGVRVHRRSLERALGEKKTPGNR